MRLSGILYDAGGPLASVRIVFEATRTTLNGVIYSAEKSFITQEDGTYFIELEPGYYAVSWIERGKPVRLGTIVADTDSEMSLPEALEADYTPMQPSYIQGALDQMRADLEAAQAAASTAAADASAEFQALIADNVQHVDDARSYVETYAGALKSNIQTYYDQFATLKLDFARGKYFVDDGELTETTNAGEILSVVRATPKWVVGPNGKYREVPPNTIARQWDPVTGEPLGALIEDEATNLFLYSDAPATQTISVTSGTVYTVSVIGSGSSDLSGAGTGSATSETPLTFTASTTLLTVTITGSVDYCQVEESSAASSMIITADSPVTRAADQVSRVLGGEFNAGHGSIVCTFELDSPVSADTSADFRRHLFSCGDGTTGNERLHVYLSDGNRLSFVSRAAGGAVNTVRVGDVDTTVGTPHTLICSFTDSSQVFFYDGVKISEFAYPLNQSAWERIMLGSQDYFVSRYLDGEIELFRYLPFVVPDAIGQELSA